MIMFRQIYTERKKYSQFDDNHFILYLNEEVIEDYVPEAHDGELAPAPCTAYAYSGTERDGGTLIEAASASYDGFVSGLVRREYSADRVEAITLNKLSSGNERKAEFDAEFSELEEYRNSCKAQARVILE